MMPAEGEPPLVNYQELVNALDDVARPSGWRVEVSSLTPRAPLVSHLAVMSQTGVLVARHGEMLANAVMLPEGAMVVELLPYLWDWKDMSRLYFNMTQSTGMIHHFAWRASDKKWCAYKTKEDERYSDWLPAECSSRECVTVHARAGLVVDVEAVAALVREKLPGIIAREPVEKLRRPWPSH